MNKKYRRAIIAGNWKMNIPEGGVDAYVTALNGLISHSRSCSVTICAPYPLLPALQRATKDSRIYLGAQNISEHASGAYTGEVSAEILAVADVRCAIIGHSERRQYYGETDTMVNAKVKAALSANLSPIICVGETLAQREAGLTMEHLRYQVKAALVDVPKEQARNCVIAYEPIWAIGTGVVATVEEAQAAVLEIRNLIRQTYSNLVARTVSILYGGSMNAANAGELLAVPDIDGGLVGGASLSPQDFAAIIAEAE